MALLINVETNETITKYISLETSQKQISVIQRTLDGAYHIQKIGSPAVSYELVAYVNRSGKALLMTAESAASLLKADVKHGIYYGRIMELKLGERLPGNWFKADITLAGEVMA